MKGPDATAEMRRRGFSMLVIGLTGNVMQLDVDVFMQNGADGVLSKPLSVQKLMDTLKGLKVARIGKQVIE